jgi:hypothetical protein
VYQICASREKKIFAQAMISSPRLFMTLHHVECEAFPILTMVAGDMAAPLCDDVIDENLTITRKRVFPDFRQ